MQRVEKNRQYAYRDRKNKKREFRKLWIIRINAACRALGMKYSEFISKLNKKNLELDRKVLANLAFDDPAAFKASRKDKELTFIFRGVSIEEIIKKGEELKSLILRILMMIYL